MPTTQDKTQPSALPRWDGPLSHPFYSKVVKRILDLTVALVALPPCLVLMLPVALMVKITSEGPVFYRAPRGGYHNKTFRIFKFRTMVVGADRFSSTTALNDPRVTKVGAFLRKTKLDELPQLFNIIKGDMSFIGPRPELLTYTTRYTPEEQCILWVRPGITDPSSIKLISLDQAVGEEDPEGTYEREILSVKNQMRVEYAKTQCFHKDVSIFFSTFRALFNKLAGKEETKPAAAKAADEGGQP